MYSLYNDPQYAPLTKEETARLVRVQKLVAGFDAVIPRDPRKKVRRSEPSARAGVFYDPVDTLDLVTSDAMSKVLRTIHVPGLGFDLLVWYTIHFCLVSVHVCGGQGNNPKCLEGEREREREREREGERESAKEREGGEEGGRGRGGKRERGSPDRI
jgi:hypothetical protein